MVSYNVKALFTSVLVDSAISIVKSKLLQDPLLSHRTSMSIQEIITLLEFCLKNTYLLFQGRYFEQAHGATMGSPISSLVTNLFMEEFESKVISYAPNPPRLCIRYMDDIFVIQHAENSHQFLQHISSIDSLLWKFPKIMDPYPSWTAFFSLGASNNLINSIYRKPTHRPVPSLGQQLHITNQIQCL